MRELEEQNRRLRERVERLEGTPSTTAPAESPTPSEPTKPAAPGTGKSIEERIDEAAKAIAEAPSVKLDRVELHGQVDAGFVWNLADPPGRRLVNFLRVSDPDHDTFAVAYASLGIQRATSGENDWDAGFSFQVAAGRTVQRTLSLDPDFNFGSPINLANGYVDLQLPTPLNPVLVRFGRFYNWFGVESVEMSTNPNFSLSYFSAFTPFTNTGVSVGMDIAGGFRYTQYLVNGWDVVIDNNDSKSLGGQLSWTLKDPAIVVAFNWMTGAERNERDQRTLVELDGKFRPIDGTEIRVAVHYGFEEHASIRGRQAKYGGFLLVFKQEFFQVTEDFRRFFVAVRGVYWRDQGGSKSGRSQALGDLTGTFGIAFSKHAGLRFEYRHDFASQRFFLGRRGLAVRDAQDTVSVDAYFNF